MGIAKYFNICLFYTKFSGRLFIFRQFMQTISNASQLRSNDWRMPTIVNESRGVSLCRGKGGDCLVMCPVLLNYFRVQRFLRLEIGLKTVAIL